MSEFNGKKFYGYSMENDPDLVGPTWNTKNFEFSCIRPETVQRAIEKVNSDVGASLKQKKSSLLGRLREKCGDGENELSNNRDPDVETNISKVQQFSVHEFEQIHAKTKQMSDGEKDSSHSHSGDDTLALKEKQSQRSMGGENTKDSVNLQKAVFEEYQQPQPKWVEISEPKLATLQMFDLRHSPLPPPPPPFGYAPNMYQMPYNPYMPPSPHMMQSVGYAYNQQQQMGNYGFQNPYGDYDPNAYLVEDSDLEDEMLRREHYTKFIQKRPVVKEIRGTDETESCAEFVNIAPQEPYTDMSYLKNTIPMRYSEMSDEEVKEEPKSQHPKVIIKKRKQAQESNSSGKAVAKNAIKKDSKKEKSLKYKTLSFAKLLAEERILSTQHEKAAKATAKRRSKHSTSPQNLHTNRKTQNRNLTEQQSNAQMQKLSLITINGKSIEQLKAEKLAIFNKMSRTHERLIDALQQLREKLLEVYVPESTSDRNRRNRNGFEFSVRFLRNFLYPLKGMIDTMRNTPREHFNSIKSNDACNRVSHIYSLFLQAVFTYSKQLRHFMIDQVPQKLTTLLEMLFSTTNICLDKRLFDRNDAIVECLLNQCSNFLSFLEDLHAQRFVAARECYRKSSGEQQQSKFDLKMFMNDLNMYEPKLVPKKSASNRQNFAHTALRKKSTNAAINNANLPNEVQLPQPPPIRRMRKRVKQSKNASKHNLERAERTSTSDVTDPKRVEVDVPTQIQNWERTSDTEQKDSREVLQNIQNILEKTPNLDKYKKVDLINRSILNALHNNRHHHTREILHPLLRTIDSVRSMPKGDNGIENILKAFQMKISTLLNETNFQHGCGKEAEELEFQNQRAVEHVDDTATHEELEEQSASNEEQTDNESNEQLQTNKPNLSNDQSAYDEEVDLDGQFYISGEDCSEKRTACMRKSKLEPLIEIVDESEAVELYSSDTELYTPLRVNIHSKSQPQQDTKYTDLILKPKQSPYDVPLSRRNNKANKKSKSPVGNPLIRKSSSRHQTSIAGANKQSSSKMKSTTVPPSPAMMRLQNRVQSPLMDYSKKNNLLKKHIRRNPMASPPPPPTVSPSTSIACTPSPNTGEFHLSLSNTSTTSHKGCSVNITNHEAVGSSELYHQAMTHSENDTNLGTFYNVKTSSSSKNVSRKLSTQKIEKIKSNEAFLSVVEDTTESGEEQGAKAQVETIQKQKIGVALPENQEDPLGGTTEYKKSKNVELNNNENGCGDHNNTTCQVHNASNSKVFEKSSVEKLHSCLNETSETKCNKECFKVDFDEVPLLKERDQYLSQCIRNRLYTNPNFATPWKILSRLSQQLTCEIVKDVESDFDIGVLSFVDDFLEQETRI